ncbi:MAG: glycosyltransferase [Pseudomonadota bacterium]
MLITQNKKITVLMPVYNAGALVGTSVRSVINQTFTDFEFLIIDDCSTDNTVAILESFSDRRIRLIKNDTNLGVARTLNRGLDLAFGKYVARMDADDICCPERLKKQYHFMERNPNVGLAGTWVKYFGDQLPVVERAPSGPEVVKAFMIFDNPIFHPSVIIRKEEFDRNKLRYDPYYNRTEDFELWLRASECFDLDNIEEPLLKYRCHKSSVTSSASEVMNQQACGLLKHGLEKFRESISSEELLLHYKVSKGQRMQSVKELCQAEIWLTKLVQLNDITEVYNNEAFRKVAEMIWFRLCQNSTNLGILSWKMSKRGLGERFYAPPFTTKIRFILSILFNKYSLKK